MSILVDQNTRLIIQGITGGEGQFHGQAMIDYGTKVVAGVTPGKGGQTVIGVPVFDSVKEAADQTGANASIIYVPAPFAADAALEAFAAGLKVVVMITEGVPVRDMMTVYAESKKAGVTLIGPNCPGIISPGKAKVGIMPGHIHMPGPIGLISRSGTLTYELVHELTTHGYGQTTCIGIGGDPIIGTNFIDALALFNADPETQAVVLIGEIGGVDEQNAAKWVKANMKKPVVGFIAGHAAPPGKRMGHAGAIIQGGDSTAADKVKALNAAGITVAVRPDEISGLMKAALGK